MGFFVGWRFFEEKDRYSFEANQERERVRREERKKKDREAKKERERKKKKAEKKRRMQLEWNEEAAKYHNEQFGFDNNPYHSGYINEDGESYKDQVAAQYGGAGGVGIQKGGNNLNRGTGRIGGYAMKKADADSPFDPKNKGPAGMNALGMENNAAVQDGQQNRYGANGKRQSNNRPGRRGGGQSGKNSLGGGGNKFSGKLSRPI